MPTGSSAALASNSSAAAKPIDDVSDVIDVAAFGIAAVISVLMLGTLLLFALRHFKVSYSSLPDSWVFMAIGLVAALILDAGSGSSHLDRVVAAIDGSFSEIFLFVLLPPIVFRSGYELNVVDFFGSLGTICVFAFGGTMLNALVMGLILWVLSQLPFLTSFSGTQALLMGTLLSATDTVAVIAVFDKLRVPDSLYSIVLGDSVLNDAVSIVAFRTLASFEASGSVSALGVLKGVGLFLLNFVGSTAVGVLIGVLNALLFKFVRLEPSEPAAAADNAASAATGRHARSSGSSGNSSSSSGGSLRRADSLASSSSMRLAASSASPATAAAATAAPAPSSRGGHGLELEKATLFVVPYIAYMVAEAFKLSGVVAILFTGIVTGKFTIRNVTPGSRRFATHLYRMLAHLAEALSFVYIGIALPLLGSQGMRAGGWPIAVIMVVLCVAARGISTFVCFRIVNYWRPPAAAISRGSAVVIWMAGLRGGVAFALATAAAKVVTSPDVAAMMPPVTIFIVLVSMLSISTSIGRVIKYFGLDGASPPPAAVATTVLADADAASTAGAQATGTGASSEAHKGAAGSSSRVSAMASRAGKLVTSALSRTAAGRTRLESGSGAASSDDDRLVRGASFRGTSGSIVANGEKPSAVAPAVGAGVGVGLGDAVLAAAADHHDASPDGRTAGAHGAGVHNNAAAALPAKAQSLLLTGHDDADAHSEHTRGLSAGSTAATATGDAAEADDVAVGVPAFAADSSSGMLPAASKLPPRWPGRVPAGAAATMAARDTDAASGSDADAASTGAGSRRSSHTSLPRNVQGHGAGSASLADSRRGSLSAMDGVNGHGVFASVSATTAHRKPAGHGHDRLFSLLSGTAIDPSPAPAVSHASLAVEATGTHSVPSVDAPAAAESAFRADLGTAASAVRNSREPATQPSQADASAGAAASQAVSAAAVPATGTARASHTSGPGARLGKAFVSVLMPPPATVTASSNAASSGGASALTSGTAGLGVRPQQPGAIKRGGHSASFSVLTSGSTSGSSGSALGGDAGIASPLPSGRSAASAPSAGAGIAVSSASESTDAAGGIKPSIPSSLRISSASAVATGSSSGGSAASSAAPSLASASKPSLSRNFSTFMSKAAEKFAAAAQTSLIRKDTAGFGRRSTAAAAANELTSAAFGLPPVPASYDLEDSSASALDAAIAAEDALVEVSFGAGQYAHASSGLASAHAAHAAPAAAAAAAAAAASAGGSAVGLFAAGRRGSASGSSEGAGAVLLSPSAGAASLTGATATGSHSLSNTGTYVSGSSGPEWDARYAIDDTPRPSKTQART